jgi:hypothetical protein
MLAMADAAWWLHSSFCYSIFVPDKSYYKFFFSKKKKDFTVIQYISLWQKI